MTAIVTPISPINRQVLIDAILELPEKQFWDLVDLRLNRPKAFRRLTNAVGEDYIEIIDANDKPSIVERWTDLCLVEQLFVDLASTKLIVSHEAKCGITVHKYYNEAFRIFTYLQIARPPPEFVVNLSDLSSRVIAELKVLRNPSDILKQSVGRIFENIDERQYHSSIASQLRVRLVK